MPGRRQFAKKSDAGVRHFKLVARSHNSELADDPNAAQLVLEPFVRPGEQRRTGLTTDELLTVPESLHHLGAGVFGLEAEKDSGDEDDGRRPLEGDADLDDDLDGDCYFPKDGYNYERHLKTLSTAKKNGGVTGVILDAKPIPRDEVFVVTKEEIDKQPAANDDEAEILRALQFDAEYEELAEEDVDTLFEGGIVEEETVIWGPEAAKYRDMPDLALFKANYKHDMFGAGGNDDDDDELEEDEDGSEGHFDARGNREDKEINDEDFEKFLAQEYADDEIGGIEDEEIEGPVAMENVEAVLDEYIEGKAHERAWCDSANEPQRGDKEDGIRTIEETKAIFQKHYAQIYEDEEDTSSGEEASEDPSRTWDCETILSNNSNLSNRPGKISRIKLVPKAPLKSVKETTGEEDKDDESGDEIVDLPDVILTRNKDETPEEKKARKASVKAMRKVCRTMKKDSKITYKAETAKLNGQAGTGDVRQKSRTFKL